MNTTKLPPIHPGEILREEFMKPLGLSQNALARALRVPPRRINEIVQEKRAISADTALRLSRCLGTTAELWTGLQADYDLRLARFATLRQINYDVKPLRNCSAKKRSGFESRVRLIRGNEAPLSRPKTLPVSAITQGK